MQCLICREERLPVMRLPFQIKRIPGGQTSGVALISANVRRKGRKKVIDKVAAQQILQTYMDRRASLRARARRDEQEGDA